MGPLTVDTCDRPADLLPDARGWFDRFKRDQEVVLRQYQARYGGVRWGGLTPAPPPTHTDAELVRIANGIVERWYEAAATPRGRYRAALYVAGDAHDRLMFRLPESQIRPVDAWERNAPTLLERARELAANARTLLGAAEAMQDAILEQMEASGRRDADATVVGAHVHPAFAAALAPHVASASRLETY